jgi:nucleoside 2-deoxyribosyltransferase
MIKARTPSKIYVAGATKEVERVRTVQGYVRTAGHEITFDWTAGIEAQTVSEAAMFDEHARTLAWRCLDGVTDADVIVLCAPKFQPTRGAWVEFGYAVAQKRGIVVLGEAGRQSIFCRLGHSFVRDDWQVALGIEDALLYRGK